MEEGKILSAYYTYNPDTEPLRPEDIDGSILTHLIVGWVDVSPLNGQLIYASYLPDGLKRCASLKRKSPHLKVMICLGSTSMSPVARSQELRQVFVDCVVALLEDCSLDGMDIDWEFPVWNSGHPEDRRNYVTLLQEFRHAFDHHSPRFILSMAGAATKLIIDPAYDIAAIAPCIDFLNLMCYDYHLFKAYDIWAGHNAPLFRRVEQRGFFATMNTQWSCEYWTSHGMPKEKIVVGIPTYARSWQLLFPCFPYYHAPCTRENCSLTFVKVQELLAQGGRRVFDKAAGVPYAYSGRQWISYEDEESMDVKTKWVKRDGYGGAMIFSLNHDDYAGVLKEGQRFPLTSLAWKNVIGDGAVANRDRNILLAAAGDGTQAELFMSTERKKLL